MPSAAALVMVGLYVLGIVAAMTVAWVIKRGDKGATRISADDGIARLSMARPAQPRHRLWERAMIFLRVWAPSSWRSPS
jgi:Fe2+ transport system protein B